jgi:AbrB family looped-hinge helix DNA binding protein
MFIYPHRIRGNEGFGYKKRECGNDFDCHNKMVMVLFNGMKDMLIPIDQAGRIVLPKHVRQELAIKPGDTFKVSVEGMAVTLTPNKESTGFVRKGKALVFSTVGGETLSEETVQKVLESGRAERDARNVKGLINQNRRG